MTQDEINAAEWQDFANWHVGLFYFSPRDSRSFVPKKEPGFGVTANLARPVGVAFVLAILVLLGAVVLRAIGVF